MSILRAHAEDKYSQELDEISKWDKYQRPPQWRLSPKAVLLYMMGGTVGNEVTITPKYIGPARLIEISIATLATDRALLLLGIPGTGKTWVAEHLAAAISGDSTQLVQGTAGTSEESIRYGWNYAHLLAHGPTKEALVPTPIYHAMNNGKIARIEELTRIPAEVQDTLITILSEKTLPIPELSTQLQAKKGFNLIATANNRDRGVNELSSALKRRFNTVILPLPATIEEEVAIVQQRVLDLGAALEIDAQKPALTEIRRLVTIFRELRAGITEDGRNKIKSPTATLSPAELISVLTNGLALAAHFGNGQLQPADLADGIRTAVIKDPAHDTIIWQEYLETVIKERSEWVDLYEACTR